MFQMVSALRKGQLLDWDSLTRMETPPGPDFCLLHHVCHPKAPQSSCKGRDNQLFKSTGPTTRLRPSLCHSCFPLFST